MVWRHFPPSSMLRIRTGATDHASAAPSPSQLVAAARVVARGFVEHAATHQAADTLTEGAQGDLVGDQRA